MTNKQRWISTHPLLTGFLVGAVLSAILSFVALEIYGLFFLPDWIEIVTAPGGIVGSIIYNHVLKSVDFAIYVGITTVGLFYGLCAVGLLKLFMSVRTRKMIRPQV